MIGNEDIMVIPSKGTRSQYIKWAIVVLWIIVMVLCISYYDRIVPYLLEILEWVSMNK